MHFLLFVIAVTTTKCDVMTNSEDSNSECVFEGKSFSQLSPTEIQRIEHEDNEVTYFYHPCPNMTIPGAKNLVMIDADEIMTNFHQIDCDPDAELPSSNTIRLCYEADSNVTSKKNSNNFSKRKRKAISDEEDENDSGPPLAIIDFVCNRKTPATPGYDENEDACGNSELCLYYRWETDISCAPSAVDYWGIVYIVLVVGVILLICA